MLRHGLQLTNRGENWHNAARMYSLVWRNEMLTSIFKMGVFWCNQTAGSWFRRSKLLYTGAVRYRFMDHLITMCQTGRPAEFNYKWLNYNDWQVTIYLESCELFWIQSPARTRKLTDCIMWSTADLLSNYSLITASAGLLSEFPLLARKKLYLWDHAWCLCLSFSLQPAGCTSWNSVCSTVGGERTSYILISV